MANVFQDIFGGSTTNQQSTSTPSNLNPFTSSLGGATNTLGSTLAGGLPQYNGALTAPITDNQTSLLNNLMTQNSQGGSAPGTNQYLQNVLSGNFMPGSSSGNPFLSASITAAQQPTINNLSQTLSRSLPGYFTANGQMLSPNNNGQGGSSAFDTAAALATQSAATTMGNIASTISSNAYNTGVQQMTAAAGLSQQEIQSTISNLNAQALPQMIQNLGISNGLQLYQENLSGVLNLLSTLGGISKPIIGNTTQSTGTTDQTNGILPDLTALFNPKGGGSGQAGAGGTGAT
jgi:hypothetical protein